MKPNELRIGNWVLVNNKPSSIDSIHESHGVNLSIFLGGYGDGGSLYSDQFDEIKPIRLTTEILEKARFRQAITNDRIWLLRIGDTNLMLHIDGSAWSYSGPILIKIEYVHQLQNLYFALTGEELEIEL